MTVLLSDPANAPGVAAPGAFADDREIWQVAIYLLRKLGGDALPLARERADKAGQVPDPVELTIWRPVARAVAELVRQPARGEWRN